MSLLPLFYGPVPFGPDDLACTAVEAMENHHPGLRTAALAPALHLDAPADQLAELDALRAPKL
jgi:hypothetical protein